MGTEKTETTMIQETLKSLCRNNGWSYAVFWRFDQRNSLLLTMEDAHYEEQMGGFIDNMLLQVHLLGNGVVGQAAYSKKHQWIIEDDYCRGQNPLGSSRNHELSQDDSEIHYQFSSGIQTIALISVEPYGVVQFGSNQKIPERIEFVDQTKRLFGEIQNCNTFNLPGSIPSSSNSEIYGLSWLFPPLASHPGNFKLIDTNCMSTTCSSSDVPRIFPFTSDHGTIKSSHMENQLQTASIEDPFTLLYNSRSQEPFVQPTDCFNNSTEFFIHVPDSHPSNSSQSSITNIFNPESDNKFLNHSIVENGLYDGLGVEFGFVEVENLLDDILMPVVSGGQLDFCTDIPECLSEQCFGSVIKPKESLFSKLGIEQRLDAMPCRSCSFASSSLESKLSSGIKRKWESCSVSKDRVNLASYPFFCGRRNSLQPGAMSFDLQSEKEAVAKSEVVSWIGESRSCESSFVSQPKKSEESVKIAKKRAKPGSRPKPKDRQQIQDRIAELRRLIPNGIKMSIDSLLAQTIKHMLFLENVTKHAGSLKKAEAQKETEVILKDNSRTGSYNATWACETGAQSMVNPVDVKDLSLPGQKQIQMLCEEKGFFLEIVDIIQGCGLTVLKGVMEVQKDKIWACFIVEAEANRHVTNQEIYLSLHQLLYQKASSEIKACDQLAKTSTVDEGTTLFTNYHQQLHQFPMISQKGFYDYAYDEATNIDSTMC